MLNVVMLSVITRLMLSVVVLSVVAPLFLLWTEASGLYCKHITIVNDDISVVNKFEALLTDKTRVVIYDVYSTGHRFSIITNLDMDSELLFRL
jgi:hypothetical protein